ncbi:hypothetical protein B6N60_01582 [Richelia sinica FACHB-800]|uniref:Uncharacterized protein n=1 Tax=Richelia sinica FACHB-800 TaxID=1357546 RepID=A0A975T6N4_9NOST|nr:hypothetical protein [Richelia sinica]MBD2663554.1 hypothetical protein [Richelia sinica FACHB-800]QXE22895.1 hypothetical protein B6N60_01582 [Richelia sinica FACHB-800]
MKKIIPFHSFTILTPDGADEVLQRLKQCLLYQGSFSEESFQITRTFYRTALTQVQGRFEKQSHQTAVHIKITLHPMFMVMLGFLFVMWYGIAVPSAFESATYIYATRQKIPLSSLPADGNITATVIQSISESTDGTLPPHLAAMYLGGPIFVLIIFIISFWADAKRIRLELTQIIRGSSDM